MSPTWNPERAYNELPVLPPAADVESKAILKQCVAARAALAGLRQASALIPNPAILINTIPLLEARASSEIENIVTTADRLFQHLHDEPHADPQTREALRYRHALLEGFQSLGERPLGTRTAEIVCARIKDAEMSVRRVPGTTLANQATGDIIYTPPESEDRLRGLLANWERFLHESRDIDPLIRMAVAHYQFEAIHPFTDGNGRTGRILNVLFLVSEGLLTLPLLYLSRYINATRADYYRLLHGVTRNGEWEPYIGYMLRGVEETALWTVAKIAAIRALEDATIAHVRQHAAKVYSRELLEVIFALPYCRIRDLGEAGIAGRQAGSKYLKQLVALGVLREQTVGRERLFVHAQLLTLLTRDDNDFPGYARSAP